VKRLLYILYQPYKWLVVVPVLVLSTFILGAMAIVIASTISPELASMTCAVWWARLNGCIAPMLVSVRGRTNIDPRQSYVIVSNHQSHYDVFVLYGWLGIDFKWVMKKELRKLPVFGFACEKMGHIYIDRSNRETAVASLEEAKKSVVNGTSVLFFPEGTRSKTGEIGEFKKGAFVMALDLGLPVLPITILGTGKILPAKTMDLFPGRANMVIHEPVDVLGCDTENVQELISVVRGIIQAGLESE
jgi:1-acyl-sn-glycerol-3-phosphate acyltransferase